MCCGAHILACIFNIGSLISKFMYLTTKYTDSTYYIVYFCYCCEYDGSKQSDSQCSSVATPLPLTTGSPEVTNFHIFELECHRIFSEKFYHIFFFFFFYSKAILKTNP